MSSLNWIPATELPDSDIDVMVAMADGITVWIGHHDGEDWIVNDMARPVEYWAELPRHPKDKDKTVQQEPKPAPQPKPAAKCPGCGHNFYHDAPMPDGRCKYCHEDDEA